MSFKRRLWIFGVAMLGVIIALGAFSYMKSSQLLSDLDDVATTQLPAVRAVTLLDKEQQQLSAIVYRVVIAAQKKDTSTIKDLAKDLDETVNKINENLNLLSKLKLPPKALTAIESVVRKPLQAFETAGKDTLASTLDGSFKIAAVDEFSDKASEINLALDVLGGMILEDANRSRNSGRNALSVSLMMTVGGVVFGIIFMIFTVRIMVRQMVTSVDSLRTSGESISASSSQLKSASIELSENAITTASALEETVASISQLDQTVKRGAESASEVSKLAQKSQEIAAESDDGLKKLNGAMTDISASSQRVGEIIDVIDDISFQTNLLALNAAVEAARAGEHGKGFAVVAEAVRTLAQKSAEAAKDIGVMIKDSVNKVENGQKLANDSSTILKRMVESINKVRVLNDEIASSAIEQRESLSMISTAIQQVDTLCQRNAAAAEEVQASAESMDDSANDLDTNCNNLLVHVTGQTDSGSGGSRDAKSSSKKSHGHKSSRHDSNGSQDDDDTESENHHNNAA